MLLRKAVLPGLLCLFSAGIVFGIESIPNWYAPASWSPPRAAGLTTLSEAPPLPFISVTPCRAADTRGNGFVGAYGPPSIAAGATRTMTLTGVCGVAASAAAVSLNVTITDISALGDVRVFPAGGSAVVSTQNWTASTGVIANAAVVPLGTGGAVTFTIDGFGAIDLIVDVNGYYASTPATSTNYFSVINSGLYAIYGETSNTGGLAAGVYGRVTAGAANGVFGESLSPADGTAGVFGRATATTGSSIGVGGVTNSVTDGATGLFGVAKGASGVTTGVFGRTLSTATDSAGVYGETRGTASGPTSGIIYGVLGFTRSLDAGSAGVAGADRSGDPGQSSFDASAGVAGESFSGYGVFGISRSGVGKAGVKGVLTDTAGAELTSGWLGYNATDGVHAKGNISATGTKPFIDPHPTDPSKEIAYVALEGPEAGTYFRGHATIHNGVGTIVVPESFRMVSDDDGLTVQITPIGLVANVAVVSADLNTVVVRSSVRELEFYYVVNGVRRAYKDWNPIPQNAHYIPSGPTAKMPAILAPEQRRALIASGIYNEDGTVNMQTAERLGWVKAWKDREERLRSAGADQRFRLDKE